MSEAFWTALAGMAGLAVALVPLIRMYLKRKQSTDTVLLEKMSNLMMMSFRKVTGLISQTQDILNSITANTSCDRAIILAAHNGGDHINLFTPQYSTALYESVTNLSPVLHDWEKQKLDEGYIKLIQDLTSKQDVILTTADMRPGILKDLYESTGVVSSHVHVIRYSLQNQRLVYLSLNFKDEKPLSAEEKRVITSSITKIKKLSEQQEQLTLKIKRGHEEILSGEA